MELTYPDAGITRDIYPMPAFATLEVSDLDASTRWYVDGLGFVNLFAIPGVLVHLRRWRYQDILLRPATGPVSPGTGASLSMAALPDELDGIAATGRTHGGGHVEGPADTAWNTRDVSTVDPDGYRLVFTAPRPVEQWDRQFADRITELHEG